MLKRQEQQNEQQQEDDGNKVREVGKSVMQPCGRRFRSSPPTPPPTTSAKQHTAQPQQSQQTADDAFSPQTLPTEKAARAPFFPSDDAWDATGESFKANPDCTSTSASGGFDGFDDDDEWGGAAKPASSIDPKPEASKPKLAIDITSPLPSTKEPPITRALSPKNNPNPPSMKLDDLRSSDGSEPGTPRGSKAPASPQSSSNDSKNVKITRNQHSSPQRKDHTDAQPPDDQHAPSSKPLGDPGTPGRHFDDKKVSQDKEVWKKRAEIAQRTEVGDREGTSRINRRPKRGEYTHPRRLVPPSSFSFSLSLSRSLSLP